MSNITPEQIVAQARTWLGTKYHHQGRLKKSAKGPGGCDCLGLIIGVIDELGLQDGNGNPLTQADEFNYSMYPERVVGKNAPAAILPKLAPKIAPEGPPSTNPTVPPTTGKTISAIECYLIDLSCFFLKRYTWVSSFTHVMESGCSTT